MLKLAELYSSIKESFDFENINPIKFNTVNDFKYISEDGDVELSFVSTEVDDNNEIVNLPSNLKKAKNIYNVQYTVQGRDDQAYKTDYKEFISILKGIKICIEKFISKYKPDILLFVSYDKFGDFKTDVTKDKLYKFALLRNLPKGYNADFDVKVFSMMDLKGIMMYRKDILEVNRKTNV